MKRTLRHSARVGGYDATATIKTALDHIGSEETRFVLLQATLTG
jgi:endonuclease V-like protein UPF0215 family